MYYTTFENPLCPMTLIGDDEGIQRLFLHTGEEKQALVIEPDWQESASFFSEAITQLKEYALGQRNCFTIKLNPQGTAFQNLAWTALTEIPFGQTRTYKEQASSLGNPKASRAVGSANGKNPIPILIPCHRVVGSNGKLTGFAFGLSIKHKLLALENKSVTFMS